jgi:hypothetical protein
MQPYRVHPGAGNQCRAKQREHDFEKEAEDFTEHGRDHPKKEESIVARPDVKIAYGPSASVPVQGSAIWMA